ncbi:hypothetical protein PTI98_001247 [Pleurotus ostreatus]|nr:hypothetical protein PTI98_001247 [Pleurotus ostreatus]
MLNFRLSVLLFIHAIYALTAKFLALWRRQHQREPLPLDAPRSKIPRHLAIVFDLDSTRHDKIEEESLFKSVYNSIAWCEAAGIEKLTLYDNQGVLRNGSALVRDHLSHLHPEIDSSESELEYPLTPPHSDDCDSRSISPDVDIRVDLHTITLNTRPPVPSKRRSVARKRRGKGMFMPGITTFLAPIRVDTPKGPPSLQIKIISRQSSKGTLAAAARSMAARRHKLQSILRDPTPQDFCISIEDLNLLLEGEEGFTSPDLMLLHSLKPPIAPVPPPELLGFPPWQIRLTEISYFPTPILGLGPCSGGPQALTLDERTFRAALDEFSGAQMRLGK